MKGLFGMVSLVVVLAIVGLLAVRQLKTAAPSLAAGSNSSTTAAADAGVATPSLAASGTVREQSRQIQDQVKNDVAKALQQGVDARASSPDQ